MTLLAPRCRAGWDLSVSRLVLLDFRLGVVDDGGDEVVFSVKICWIVLFPAVFPGWLRGPRTAEMRCPPCAGRFSCIVGDGAWFVTDHTAGLLSGDGVRDKLAFLEGIEVTSPGNVLLVLTSPDPARLCCFRFLVGLWWEVRR